MELIKKATNTSGEKVERKRDRECGTAKRKRREQRKEKKPPLENKELELIIFINNNFTRLFIQAKNWFDSGGVLYSRNYSKHNAKWKRKIKVVNSLKVRKRIHIKKTAS